MEIEEMSDNEILDYLGFHLQHRINRYRENEREIFLNMIAHYFQVLLEENEFFVTNETKQ